MRWQALGLAALAFASPALAAPGMGNEVLGTEVSPGEIETELRYDRLAGGAEDGEDVVQLEASYAASGRLRLAIQAEFEREAGQSRQADSLGIQALYVLGRLGGVDVAVYGQYEIGFDRTDSIEAKLVFQHRPGPADLRLNLIAEKPLSTGAPVELSYAVLADSEISPNLRLGAQAFGELGTFRRLFERGGHFAGPVARLRLESSGLELEASYLVALGSARDDTKGQVRIALGADF